MASAREESPSAGSGHRLLLVSNRLPVTVRVEGGRLEVTRSSGGLATGLSGPHERSGGLWVGWPGDVGRLSPAQRLLLDTKLAALRCVPVLLSEAEVSRFYEGFSNRVLWPLFHYLLEHVPEHSRDWETYRRVNERFADEVAARYRPGDTLWVQDYQLMLVPKLLRDRLPDARIGFFLHIPFPSSEVFRTLPWRSELLAGLLGSDLIGFHTLSYLRHFCNALTQVLGLSPDVDGVGYEGRRVRLGAFPMGVDAQWYVQQAGREEVRAEAAAIRASAEGQRLLVGVDRMDYTKGLRRRLLAVGRLLEREPQLRGRVRFIQVAAPSRGGVADYERHRQSVDELVGRINGAYGSPKWVPVHYLFRSYSAVQLAALYQAADVMLVTPLRDGMNLVAKEFLASRVDGDGVLVLSEFAGAASELGEAIIVNPYDVDGMAQGLKSALALPEQERRLRMAALRGRVLVHDVHEWVKRFLQTLEAPLPARTHQGDSDARAIGGLVASLSAAPRWCLFLDYDGTLREFTTLPELALPDPELLKLLEALGRRPGARVHVVSGRTRDFLETYLGRLPVSLHAEHGLFSKDGPGAPWRPTRDVPTEWKARVRPLIQAFVDQAPGTFIEEKTASLAFHYRRAEPLYATAQARELQLHLAQTFSNAPVELLPGERVLEVRALGVNKGVIVAPGVAAAGRGAAVLAMGDDQTDEDLFAALPPGSLSVHVGPRPSVAAYRLRDVSAARAFLRRLLPEVLRDGLKGQD